MVLLPPSSSPPAGGGEAARSVSELRALSLRQQQQLSWQQQQLVAREQRLRFLRQAGHPEPQEVKLRRLRAQLDQQQAGNASLAAELEAVRALFAAKEQELSVAAAKVEELTRQLEELRRHGRPPRHDNGVSPRGSSAQQVEALDRRIAELRQRLHKKRLHNSQQQPLPPAVPPAASNVATVEPRPRSDPKYQTLPYNTKFRGGPPAAHHLQCPSPAADCPGEEEEEEEELPEDHKPPHEHEQQEVGPPETMVEGLSEDPPAVSCPAEPCAAVVDGAQESPEEEEEEAGVNGGDDATSPPAGTEQQQRPESPSPPGGRSSAVPARRGNLRRQGSSSCGGGRRVPQRVSFDPLALLLDAALEGELDLVRTTVAQVPDPSAANDEGITALHNAICAGHLDIVKFLVQFGCDVNAQDSDGWTPLHCAASCNNLCMVRFLVEHGACVFAATLSDHETAADKCEEDEEGFEGCSEFLYGVQDKLGAANGGMAYAVYDYEARQPDELSFRMGEALQVLRRPEDQPCWWWARLLRTQQEGYVPRNLLGLYPRVQPCRPSPEG